MSRARTLFIYLFIFVGLRLKPRAWHLLGRYSLIWATPPLPYNLFVFTFFLMLLSAFLISTLQWIGSGILLWFSFSISYNKWCWPPLHQLTGNLTYCFLCDAYSSHVCFPAPLSLFSFLILEFELKALHTTTWATPPVLPFACFENRIVFFVLLTC
jgi:hypothetical protein